MAAGSSDIKEHTRKRVRENTSESSASSENKYRKKENTVVEISMQTYCVLPDLNVIVDEDIKKWNSFKEILQEFFSHEEVSMDDPNSNVIRVSRNVLDILKKVNYINASTEDLKIKLQAAQELIDILTKLRRFSRIDEREREELFSSLKEIIETPKTNLIFTEPSGWNVLHIVAFCGRADLLLSIQNTLLPTRSKQYENLLYAETKSTHSTPLSIARYYRHEEVARLLENAKMLVVLKKLKNFEKINEQERKDLYERIKQLIVEGVDPTLTEQTRGWNILHLAVNFNAVELVKLIKDNVSPQQYEILLNTKTKESQTTPFAMAANRRKQECDNEEIIQLLEGENISQPSQQFGVQSLFFESVRSGSVPTDLQDKTLSKPVSPTRTQI